MPKAMVLDARGQSKHVQIGSIEDTGYQHSQGGFFDTTILCHDHEDALNPFDTYAVDFCRNYRRQMQILPGGRFLIPNVDTEKLVKFAASVLWRFSVSAVRGIPQVNLGKFQDQFRDFVFGTGKNYVEPSLIIWVNESSAVDINGLGILPATDRHLDRRFWSFIFSGVSFVLKVDQQPLPPRIAPLAINGRDFILSAFKPFDNSPELQQIMKISKNMTLPRKAGK